MDNKLDLLVAIDAVGTVTSVTSANSDVAIVTPTTTPVLTLNSGVGANKIVKQDSTGKLPSINGSQLIGLTAGQVSLGNVNNTSDANKPVSTATANALSGKEPLITTKNTAFNRSFETNTANIKANGTAAVGTSSNVPRADHVHPSDIRKVDKIATTTTNNIVTFSNNVGGQKDSGVSVSVDGKLLSNSDLLIPSQKAVKTYVDTHGGVSINDVTPSTTTVYSSSKVILLLADKEKKSSYDVRDYGAKGDGSTDDTLSIQNAINAAFADGGGTVYFYSNTYIASSIVLKERVRLLGDGESSVIEMKSNTNANFIKVFDEYTGWCGLESLKIDGNKTNNTKGHAVYFARSIYGDDSHLFLKNIHITEAPEDGFRVYGGQHREGRYINVTIDYCGGFGFYHDGSDNNMVCITSWRNGLAGFYENGSSNRWVSCKTFQCNTKDRSAHDAAGWLIYNGERNTFTDCEAQESFGHGWYLEICRDMTLQGCVADCNGITSLNQQTTSDLTKNGFDINVCSKVLLNGCMCADFRQDDNGNYKTQNIGVHLNYCTNCIINVICSKQQIDVKDDHDEGVYANLKVVNGVPTEYLKIDGTIAQRLSGIEDAMIEIHRDNSKNWAYGQNGLDKSFRFDRYDPVTESWQDSPINLPVSGGAVLGGVLLKNNSIVNASNVNSPVSIGGVSIITKAAIPTTGTWAIGSLVYNTNPKANGYIGWVCITAGTPGVWKGFGLIQT